jgi:hypothetical protein
MQGTEQVHSPTGEATLGKLLAVFVGSGAAAFAVLSALYAGGTALARDQYYRALEDEPCRATQLLEEDARTLSHAALPIGRSIELLASQRPHAELAVDRKPPVNGWVRAGDFERRVRESEAWQARQQAGAAR